MEIAAAVLGVLGTALTIWLYYVKQRKPRTPQDELNDRVEQDHQMVASGDAARVNDRLNKLLSALRPGVNKPGSGPNP